MNNTSFSQERTVEVLKNLAENQSKIAEVHGELKLALDRLEQNFTNIKESIDLNNAIVDKANETISDTTTVIDGIKDIIKEFSIYASNRENADKHLTDNMNLLSDMWQGSLDVFSETKDIMDNIHKYAEVLSSERVTILSKLPSKKYGMFDISMLEEWLIDAMASLIQQMSFETVTYNSVEQWIVKNLQAYERENGYSELPRFKDLNEQVKIFTIYRDKIKKEYNTTVIFDIMYWAILVIYQCTLHGVEFINHPMFSKLLEMAKNLEDKVYG